MIFDGLIFRYILDSSIKDVFVHCQRLLYIEEVSTCSAGHANGRFDLYILIEQTVRFRDVKFDEGVLILDLKNTEPVEKRKAANSAKDLQQSATSSIDW